MSLPSFVLRVARAPQCLPVALAVLCASGCRNALLDTPQPVVRSALTLHVRTATADTVHLTLSLGTGPIRALGSLTATLTPPPMSDGAWRLLGCAAAQGEPLIACKAHEREVRVAAAWAAETHTGPLLTLTYVRSTPSASPHPTPGTTPAWQLAVQEVHGVSGQSLLSELDVTIAPAAGGAP